MVKRGAMFALLLGLFAMDHRLDARSALLQRPAENPGPSTFERAREIFANRCLACHGETKRSNLDLRQRETILQGGTRGPALIPGNPEESLLFQTVTHAKDLRMPFGKPQLPPAEIEVLRAWIKEGAPWGSTEIAGKPSAAKWWAFQKPQRPSVPAVKDTRRARNPIDAFILHELENKGLRLAPQASKLTLIRRAFFDLIGMPPTPEQIKHFLEDSSPDAYEKLIDVLLASPHYGERWGRHWLDVARYADSGGFGTDIYYPYAWRYRDYVIKSFNDDKPYDRFIQEQIAGDELWPDNLDLDGTFTIPPDKMRHLEARIATGLYTIGPFLHEIATNGEQLRSELLADSADTTGHLFLGLTLGCARCHDHKYDPITHRDYYRFQAIFAGSEEVEIPVTHAFGVADHKQTYPLLLRVDQLKGAVEAILEKARRRLIDRKKAQFPREVVAAYEMNEEKLTEEERYGVVRSAEQKRIVESLVDAINSITSAEIEAALDPEERRERENLVKQIGEAYVKVPSSLPKASVLGHAIAVPEVHVLRRGTYNQKGESVAAGFPAVLSDGKDLAESSNPLGFGRRKALALWLSRRDHPLTARIMVNRIWQWHFGRGIVGTPNDFGRQGELPSHPELLDWLATEFVDREWSLKSMHRLIMLSNTYQLDSQYSDAANLKIDPESVYLWRFTRRRLEAEIIRDSILAAAGSLNLKRGGPPVIPNLEEDEFAGMRDRRQWPISTDPLEHNRRGIYIYVKRSFSFPMFKAFDGADSGVSCPRRESTTVAPQALTLLNSPFVMHQAKEFAARLLKENGDNRVAWVDGAWRLALARTPTGEERQKALHFLNSDLPNEANAMDLVKGIDALSSIPATRGAALVKLCLMIFNLNEFVYID